MISMFDMMKIFEGEARYNPLDSTDFNAN